MSPCLSLTKHARKPLLAAWALLGLGLLSGCDENYTSELRYPPRTDPLLTTSLQTVPARFDRPGELDQLLLHDRLSKDDANKVLDPSRLPADKRQSLQAALEQMFGTPLRPTVQSLKDVDGADTAGVDERKKALRLDDATLAEGSRLYRLHCVHCHGLSGNGRGPTAPWINPHPRDFRQGIFKFTSSGQDAGARKALRQDLVRTMREGVEGTAMPSFGLYPEEQLQAIASYVIHLSLRGECEYLTIKTLTDQADTSVTEFAQGALEILTERWVGAEKNLIRPQATPPDPKRREESVTNGWKLFRAESNAGGAGCISCHEDYGRKLVYKPDVWGTVVRPANLTLGEYRGGRRPIDLYWRIHSGINGSGMPAVPNTLTSQQIWDIVSFLQVLPYEQMRKEYKIEVN